MANSTKPIYKIRQLQEGQSAWGDDNYEEFDIGATFKNVMLNETSDYSLQTLFDYVSDLSENAQFTYTGKDTPSSSNVKVWYDTNQ